MKMNWKRLLQTDLSQLLTGKGAGEAPEAGRRYFWNRLAAFVFGRRHQPGDRPQSLKPPRIENYWGGPVYWSGRAWRRDVLALSEYTRSLVASNVPLAAGMAAAVREEQRRRSQWTPQRATRLVGIALLFLMMVFLGGGIALDSSGVSGEEILQALVLIALAIWFLRIVVFAGKRRLRIYAALEQRLSSGAGLSEAMASLPRVFPSYLVDLVTVGEETGDVEGAFAKFNDGMLRSLDRNRQLQWTLRYLTALVIAQALILSFLIVKVLPVFVEINEEIYAESKEARTAPAPLRTADQVQDAFDVLVYRWPRVAVAGAVIAMAIALVRFRLRRGSVRGRAFSPLFLVPWLRGMVVRQNLGLIAAMLHGLLRGGVPLDRALAMCSSADLHGVYRRWLSDLRESLREGNSLKDALVETRRPGFIPDSFIGQLEAGEYAGQLPEMCARIAELYQRDVEKRAQVLAGLVLPLGILTLGYITLFAQTLAMRLITGIAEALIV